MFFKHDSPQKHHSVDLSTASKNSVASKRTTSRTIGDINPCNVNWPNSTPASNQGVSSLSAQSTRSALSLQAVLSLDHSFWHSREQEHGTFNCTTRQRHSSEISVLHLQILVLLNRLDPNPLAKLSRNRQNRNPARKRNPEGSGRTDQLQCCTRSHWESPSSRNRPANSPLRLRSSPWNHRNGPPSSHRSPTSASKSPPIVFGFRSSATLSSSSTMIHLRSFSSSYSLSILNILQRWIRIGIANHLFPLLQVTIDHSSSLPSWKHITNSEDAELPTRSSNCALSRLNCVLIIATWTLKLWLLMKVAKGMCRLRQDFVTKLPLFIGFSLLIMYRTPLCATSNSTYSYKVCGCYLVRFSCSPTSTDKTHTTKLVMHSKSTVKHMQKPDWKYGCPTIIYLDDIIIFLDECWMI